MNIPTLIVLLAVGFTVFLAIRSIVKSKQAGKGCGCGCEGCSQACGKNK